MRTKILVGIGLVLLGSATPLFSQDVVWKASKPAESARIPAVSLGMPSPLSTRAAAEPIPAEVAPRLVRGQGGSPPPPPKYPGMGEGPPSYTPVPSGNPYDNGVLNSNADLGGFWSSFSDKFKRCWSEVIGGVPSAFQQTPNRVMFQSDREYEIFISPVSNPFYFEDPRALTELRPIFIWQHTPGANPVWNGGDNFALALRGSVAFTPNISLVVHRLGWTFINPKDGTPEINTSNGFSELHLGPKITFLRNPTSNTLAAFGVTFELPTGPASVLQDTGSLSIAPYFSFAQNFGRSQYGSFNFMNTTGYVFRADNQRSESFYSSFHLDFDVSNAKRFYPLVELNWRQYTRNGGARDLNFEGNDLANFGSRSINNIGELTFALGGRAVINNNIQFGIATEFNVLGNSSGRHLDQFRLTTDLIFRY